MSCKPNGMEVRVFAFQIIDRYTNQVYSPSSSLPT